MNKDTFQHGRFYKITRFGRINLSPNGRNPLILSGKGELVWFVGLVWKDKTIYLDATNFYLIASNFYKGTDIRDLTFLDQVRALPVLSQSPADILYVYHNEKHLNKRDRVKQIELYTLKDFPLLIGTKTTTLFERFLRNEISTKGFPNGKIV